MKTLALSAAVGAALVSAVSYAGGVPTAVLEEVTVVGTEDMPVMQGKVIYNPPQAERAWGQLTQLFKSTLV